MDASPDHSVAILSAVRTPIGKHGGALRATPATALGVLVARAAIARARLAPPQIDDVLFGQTIQAGAGQNPARQVLRGAEIPDPVGAATINMVCGSGLKALLLGNTALRAGDSNVALVGGMESMSCAPYLVPSEVRWGTRFGNRTLEDAMLKDSLLDAYGEHEHMGLTGDRIAEKFHLSRTDVDTFALRSHRLASAARVDGTWANEIVPVPPDLTPRGAGLEQDEGPRADTSLEALARLKPVFRPDGVQTAGNSSQLSDGAAALVLASAAFVDRHGLAPLAWIHSGCVSGVNPRDVMESPIPTVRKHLERTGFAPADFDRVEHNEAFASASIAIQRTFGFTDRQFNVHGGAVALGHPIGASGARIVVSLVHELVRSNSRLGLATLCMGGGNGLSVIVDRRPMK
ncbi:MAG: acetyl-CoA C-acyltransferase [Thermoplasmata archaeon]